MRGRIRIAAVSAVVSVALVFAPGLSVLADTIHLTDGRQMHGTVTEMRDDALTLRPSETPDAPVTIAWSDVEYAALQSGDCLQLAGQRLTDFRTKYFIGMGLSVTGGFLTIIGLISSRGDPTSVAALIGSLFNLAGAGLMAVAFWDIGSAGDALKACQSGST